MPRIPDYQQQVTSSAGPELQVQTSAPIEAFGGGQALQGIETASKLADQSAQMFTDIKKQADVAKVLQANDLTLQAKNQSLYDPKTGAMNLKGQSAFGAVQSYGEAFRTKTDEIAAGLDNDDQRAMYQKVRDKHATEFQDTLEKHTFAEAQSFQKEQYASSLKTIQDDTTLNYFVPGKVQESVERAKGIALQQANVDGITDPEMRDQRVRDVQSKLYSGVIERMMNTSDPKAAGYYFANQDKMTAEDRDRIDKTLKVSTLAAESSRKADELSQKFPDLTSQLAEAKQMEGGELRDKVIQRLKENSTDQKMALEADSNRRYSALSSIVEQSGGRATLPLNELMKMTSEDRAKLEARARQLKEGVTAEKSSRAYYKYMSLAADKPGDFQRMNLDTIRGQVTSEELAKFIGIQNDLKDGKGSKALGQHRTAAQIASEGADALGLRGRLYTSKDDKKNLQDYQDEFFRRVDRAEEEKGKPLNNEELVRLRDDMATTVITKRFGGLWNSKTPAYDIEPLKDGQPAPTIHRIEDVPKQTLQQIRTEMGRRGIKYTEDAALMYANEAMRKKLGK